MGVGCYMVRPSRPLFYDHARQNNEKHLWDSRIRLTVLDLLTILNKSNTTFTAVS